MARRLFLNVVFMLICMALNAQTAIKGKVLDGSMNGEPMIGASVQVPGTSAGTVTNIDGEFSFTLPQGKSIIQVSMIGFKTQVINVKERTTQLILKELI